MDVLFSSEYWYEVLTDSQPVILIEELYERTKKMLAEAAKAPEE